MWFNSVIIRVIYLNAAVKLFSHAVEDLVSKSLEPDSENMNVSEPLGIECSCVHAQSKIIKCTFFAMLLLILNVKVCELFDF